LAKSGLTFAMFTMVWARLSVFLDMPSALATLSRARPLTGSVNLTAPVAFLPRPDAGPAAACRAFAALRSCDSSASAMGDGFAQGEIFSVRVFTKLAAQDVVEIDHGDGNLGPAQRFGRCDSAPPGDQRLVGSNDNWMQ
jgi:hypothetical protein